MTRMCSIEGCDRRYTGNTRDGLCRGHYRRLLAYGDVGPARLQRRNEMPGYTGEEKLLLNSDVDPVSGCWRFRHGLNAKGYGALTSGGVRKAAHRLAYELWVGPIPDGLVIDHVRERGCTYTDCVNPAHLEAVTFAENVRRGVGLFAVNRRKTHCAHGHEFTPENTQTDSRGYRRCRECRRLARLRDRSAA